MPWIERHFAGALAALALALAAPGADAQELAVPPENQTAVAVTIDDFGNTPLTDLMVEVDPQTNATEATVFCVSGTDLSGTHLDGNGDSSGTDVDGAQGATATWDKNGLRIGEYTCKVVITDP